MRRVPGPHRKMFTHWQKIISFVRIKIEDHKVDLDPSAPRDYIDCFLSEMEKVSAATTFLCHCGSLSVTPDCVILLDLRPMAGFDSGPWGTLVQ